MVDTSLLSSPKRTCSYVQQLKELVTNETLVTMFPNLNTLANISLSIPVSTASVERSFSQMKLLKTRLRNHLSNKRTSPILRKSLLNLRTNYKIVTLKKLSISGTEKKQKNTCLIILLCSSYSLDTVVVCILAFL